MSIAARAISRFGVFLSLVGLGAQPSETSSGAVPAEGLYVRLYNLAGVSARTLKLATRNATEVLAIADNVRWDVQDDAPEAHIVDLSVRSSRHRSGRGYSDRNLVVIIERGFPDSYHPDELGYALPDATIGVNASVFYDRIERLHKSAEIDLPILLGHALAHEIGHVLLGTKDHSATGIMKPRWSKADFEVGGLTRLCFTPEQSQRMRDEVLRRSAGRFCVD